MDVIGIIVEYNPFHNGHLYHLNEIKRRYPNSLIIAILPGYFMQRGELSVISKEEKIKIALDNNINIVLELPSLYATQSADVYAYNAIKILNEFKINRLIFGSETNNCETLRQIAEKNIKEEDIKKYLKMGLNYPTALKKALNIDFSYNNPNDLLAISYIKAIINNNYDIKYETIKRTSNYHDKQSNAKVISASNIRNKIMNNIDIKKFVPINYKNFNKGDNLFTILKYKIITSHNLDDYLDVSEGLDNLLKKEITKSNDLEDLIKRLKSKRYTYNRLKRMLIHILLGIRKIDSTSDTYIRILGFNKSGQKYIKECKKSFTLPIYNKDLDSIAKTYEKKASFVYDLINNTNTFKFEIENKPIIK